MNFLAGLFILAARGEDRKFSWVIPVAFVAIWIIGGIGKVIAGAKEDRKLREKQGSAPGQSEDEMRYKPIPDASSQGRRDRTMVQNVPVQRVRDKETMPVAVPGPAKVKPKRSGTVAALKKAMHDAMEEASSQQQKTQSPKPVAARSPKRVQRKATQRTAAPPRQVSKEPAREIQPQQEQESIVSGFKQRDNIRKAIIYSEIIGKPLALRQQ